MATTEKTVAEAVAKSTTAKKAGKKKRKRVRKRGGAAQGGTRKPRTFPSMTETIQIDHSLVAGAFDRDFERFRSAFFHSTSILGKFGLDEGIDAVHKYVVSVIDKIEREVERATASILQDAVKAGASKDVPRTTPQRLSRKAEVPAYVVRRYLQLFPVVDRMLDAIVVAESHGAIGWSRRGQLLRAASNYLRSPTGRFYGLAMKLGARQSKSEKGMAEAKKAMEVMLANVVAEQERMKGVEETKPIAKKKAAKAG